MIVVKGKLKINNSIKIALSILLVVCIIAGNALFVDFYSFKEEDALAVNSDLYSSRSVYIGGMAVGLSVKSDGVVVTALGEVETAYGKTIPKSNLEVGDVIVEIGGESIKTTQDITKHLRALKKEKGSLELKILRDSKAKTITAYPAIEQYTEYFSLGIVTKDFLEGIGTVTFIRPTGEFASLGHPINSSDGKLIIPSSGGNVYGCRIVGFNKGKKGNPGELKGTFTQTGNIEGKVIENTRFGVVGKFNAGGSTELVEIGNRHEVKTGKAHIITTIKDKPEKFEVEIIKVNPQSSPSEKGIVVKVTDKRLLEATGGIVSGMSGSPIIQNGKLVAAVTHVFVSDPAKGYGVYIDWMY